MSYPDGYTWQPIASYAGEPFALFRDQHDRPLFGEGVSGVWRALIDGELYEALGYAPVEWATVPEDQWADWGFG